EDYTIRGLFSVKYYFDKVYTDEEEEYSYMCGLPGFVYKNTQNGFYVYENQYYIPMGFTYDYYMTEDDADDHTEQTRERSLLRALVLSGEDAEKYSDIISPIPADQLMGLDEMSYIQDCAVKLKNPCYDFTYDSEGFAAKIDLDSSKLVFFSVPYDSGWTAYVNGEPADIAKANYGFMAVKAEAGENTIEFKYETPGLMYGMFISIAGIILLAAYLFVTRRCSRNISRCSRYYDYEKPVSCQAEKNYIDSVIKNIKGGKQDAPGRKNSLKRKHLQWKDFQSYTGHGTS
ncbi:MAG: YfhO family protein, partial [Porcipelethomonas sp.]